MPITPRNVRYRKDEMRYRKRQNEDCVSLVYVLGARITVIHITFSHNYSKKVKL